MNPREESGKLMNAVLPLAEKMLSRYGEFHPYGGYMRHDGTIVEVGAEDLDADLPKSEDLIYILRSSFQEMARIHQCRAVAMVFDVAVSLPASNDMSDAIQVCVDHVDGYSTHVFSPYKIIENEVVYGATFAQEGDHEIFGRPDPKDAETA